MLERREAALLSEDEDDTADEDTAEDDIVDEDTTAWRAGVEEDASEAAVDDRVASAFEALNRAIAHNNKVESAYSTVQRQYEEQQRAGQEVLAKLERRHARQLRKIEQFRKQQSEAREAECQLRRVAADLETAREVLGCSTEALECLKCDAVSDGPKRAPERDAGWLEAEATLLRRRQVAADDVRRLEAERRRCMSAVEHRTRRLIAKSAALGELAEEALPFLARQSSLEYRQANLEASVRERGEETAQAKEAVKAAMGNLEQISLDIMRQQADEG